MIAALSKSTVTLGIATISNYVLFIFLARTGGAEAFSLYLYNLTIAGILSMAILYASQRVFTREVLDGRKPQDAFNTIMTIKIALGLIACAGVVIYGMVSGNHTAPVIFFLAFFIFTTGFLFEYYGENYLFARITLAEKLFHLVASVSVISLFGFGDVVYWLYLAGSLVSIALQFRVYWRHVKVFRPAPVGEVFRFLRRHANLVMIDMVQLTYGNYSRVIIQAKKGLIAFGAVSVAFQLIKLASIFQTQVDYFFRPTIIRLVEARDAAGLAAYLRKYLLFTTLPTAAGSAFLMIFADPLINIAFGAEFAAAAPALRVVAVLPVLVNLMRFAETVFIGLKRNDICLYVNVASCACLMLALLAVPADVSTGVFLATIVAAQGLYVAVLTVFARALWLRKLAAA